MSIGHKCDSCATTCPECVDADLLIYRINHAYYVNYSRPGSVSVDELLALLRQVKSYLERENVPLAGAQPAPAAPSEPVAWMHIQGNHLEPSLRQLDDDEKARGWEQFPLWKAAPAAQPADRAAQWLVEVRDQFRQMAEQANQALTRHVADLAQPADSARQKSIREDFELIADAHMHVFGMAHSPAREQAWDALKTALERNMNRG